MASETGCPIEMHKIPINKCDEMFDADCQGDKFMPFHRAHYDPATGQSPNTPREQQNSMTSWIDASFVYSTKVRRCQVHAHARLGHEIFVSRIFYTKNCVSMCEHFIELSKLNFDGHFLEIYQNLIFLNSKAELEQTKIDEIKSVKIESQNDPEVLLLVHTIIDSNNAGESQNVLSGKLTKVLEKWVSADFQNFGFSKKRQLLKFAKDFCFDYTILKKMVLQKREN